MNIVVDELGKRREIAAEEGQNLLDVLQANHIEIPAACGGIGKCGKCQVLVNDGSGLAHRLACEVEVREGLEVVVEKTAAIEAVETGLAQTFVVDAHTEGIGVAIDVGTTTLALHLHDLQTGARLASASRANPQSAFGADVISRITASVDGKLDLMTGILQDTLDTMIDDVCKHARVPREQLVAATLAGNTVMQHIACGLAPDTIGVSPFTPLSLFGDMHSMKGLPDVYFTHCVAGYVGGDIVAGLLARNMLEGPTKLFLDLGTNGEMALCHEGKIYCCATAAGPVFEGANIFFGMPALPGAISKVAYEGGQLQVSTLGDADAIGICGTGIVDAIAVLRRLGVVDESGYLCSADEVDEAYRALLDEVDGGHVCYLNKARHVYLTQKDVRCVQLAKAAVCAGIHTLLHHAGISTSDVDVLDVAGGFGAFIDMHSAACIGLFPPELEDRAQSVGNTSAEGAAALLLSSQARSSEQDILDACSYIELSTSKEFNEYYIDLMEFAEIDS